MLVQTGIAYGDYPVLDTEGVTYDATPADPDGTWVPKCFFRPANYHIEQFSVVYDFPKGMYVHYDTTSVPTGRGKNLNTFCVFDSNYMFKIKQIYLKILSPTIVPG